MCMVNMQVHAPWAAPLATSVMHPADLWVVAKLVVEALPGTFIWVCDGDVVGVGQRPQPLPAAWDGLKVGAEHPGDMQ